MAPPAGRDDRSATRHQSRAAAAGHDGFLTDWASAWAAPGRPASTRRPTPAPPMGIAAARGPDPKRAFPSTAASLAASRPGAAFVRQRAAADQRTATDHRARRREGGLVAVNAVCQLRRRGDRLLPELVEVALARRVVNKSSIIPHWSIYAIRIRLNSILHCLIVYGTHNPSAIGGYQRTERCTTNGSNYCARNSSQ
jgi:hypothetical protein